MFINYKPVVMEIYKYYRSLMVTGSTTDPSIKSHFNVKFYLIYELLIFAVLL